MLNAFLTENTLAGFLFLLIVGASAGYGIISAALCRGNAVTSRPLGSASKRGNPALPAHLCRPCRPCRLCGGGGVENYHTNTNHDQK